MARISLKSEAGKARGARGVLSCDNTAHTFPVQFHPVASRVPGLKGPPGVLKRSSGARVANSKGEQVHDLPGARRVAGFLLISLLAGCGGGSGEDQATRTEISTNAITFTAAAPDAPAPD